MPLASGTRIGPYEVVAPLGAGGMGEVYRALDTRLKREAALKCLPDRLSGETMALERFRREAQLLAGLGHPHIAAVYGLETSVSGAAVLAMELVPGETLAERLRRGPTPPAEAIALARQLAEALEYAHERGVIHRDLKPANIKIASDDQVKVLDFGLAKALSPELSSADISDSPTLTSPATLAGTLLGTAAYMAPEQARGKPADRRADIWAFGVVLYEMLTGARPFHGDDVTDTIAAVVRDEPDWTRLPPATPPALRQLLQRSLRKDVRQRLQSIGDARIALEEIAAGDAPAPPAAAPARRSWLSWVLPAVAGIVIAGAAAFFLLPRPPATIAMHFQALTSMKGVQRDPALSPDGRSFAFVSDRDGSYNVYVGVIGGSSLVQITHGTAVKASPAWTPDGASLAYSQLNDSALWDIWEVAALGGTPRLLVRNAKYPAWSPSGQELAYVQTSTQTLWIEVPGQPPRQLAPGQRTIADPRFSPDGRQIAFIAGSYGGGPYTSLQVINLGTGSVRQLTAITAGMALSPAWTPDGRSIYYASSQGGTFNIWKIPAAGGPSLQVTAGQGDDAELDLSRDGKRLAFATFHTDTRIAEMALTAASNSNAIHVITNDPARNQNFPVYSPDGKRLAYFSFLKGVEREQIWVSNADGSEATALVENESDNIFPEWSDDGSQVVFESWSPGSAFSGLDAVPASGGDPRTLGRTSKLVLCTSSRGPVIYSDWKRLESLDLATGQSRALAPLPSPAIASELLCAPDGGAIAYAAGARYDGDPRQGIWVYDFHHPARQIYHGWVGSEHFSLGPRQQIYFLAARPDLSDQLLAVGWDGTGLRAMNVTVPALYDYFWGAENSMSVAPGGAAMAFMADDALQVNLGLITFGKN
ncbi:MAG: protein kinase domain-containing protein [Terriglobales bacterium]